MTQQWPHNSQSRALFASPPSTGLPYPSYTPFPSRTNTPAYSVSRSSSSSGSFGHQSVGHSSVGKRSKGSWKSLGHPRRSQTAPWKGTQYGSPSGTLPRDMSYYQYYQQAPGWATAQYEPLPPPMPSYHPAANWGGSDYYAAHSGDNDRSLFDSVWGRFKSAIGMSTQGYSRQHAKQIYRRVYGGMTDLLEVPPEELGASAGYEAVRIWEQHHNLFQLPLNHDLEREREALGGLAIGEANKLWIRANPYRNRHGRRVCAEVAIATAERIFTFQYDQGGGVAPYLSPEQQLANASLMNPSLVQSPYSAIEGPPYDTVGRPRTVSFSGYGGRRSRRGSFSNYDQPSVVPIGGGPIGGGGMYQNPQGYTIAGAPPMGAVPFPGEYPPSPRFAGRVPLTADPYDDYPPPMGAGMGAPGSYGAPMGAPGSYGSGYGGGYQPPVGPPGSYGAGALLGAPGSYGGGGGGYDDGYIVPSGYRRQRSRSQGYRY